MTGSQRQDSAVQNYQQQSGTHPAPKPGKTETAEKAAKSHGSLQAMGDQLLTSDVMQLPILNMLSFMGLWTMHVWIYWFNLTPLCRTASAATPSWVNIYGIMTIALIALCIVFAGRASRQHAIGRFDTPMTVLMAVAVISTAALGILTGGGATSGTGIGGDGAGSLPPLAVALWNSANIGMAGICMAWGYARWLTIYARLGIRDAVICLFASYMIGSTLKIIFDILPGIVGAVLALALPLISTFRLRLSGQILDNPESTFGPARADIVYTRGNGSLGPLVRIAICVFVFTLARTLLPGTEAGWSRLLGHLVEIAFSAVVIVWVARLNRSLDFPQLWRFVFLFLATGVALVATDVASIAAGLCALDV